MAVTKRIPARDFEFELNTGTSAVPVWTEILGLDSWSRTQNATDADTTTFDDAGWESHMKIRRSYDIGLTGKFIEDTSDGSRDPGQEAVEAWALQMGAASVKEFRITSPGGTVAFFEATCSTAGAGGGSDADPTKWEASIKTSGSVTVS
jgi:hypothetical protein